MTNSKSSPEFQLNSIQNSIQEFGFDGWLLYDFRGLNALALKVLGISEATKVRGVSFTLFPRKASQ